VPKIDLSLFDIATIEAKHQRRPSKKTSSTNVHHECARPLCSEPADYKAPQSPQNLNNYRYFCLKHIREHNKRWNYCENMTEEDIIQHLEKDMVGHRPTWQSGMHTNSKAQSYTPKPEFTFDDPFDFAKTIFEEGVRQEQDFKQKTQKNSTKNTMAFKHIHEACQALLIEYPPQYDNLRESYKKLVKQYHPDINKDDPDAEQKLRQTVHAYKVILEFLGK